MGGGIAICFANAGIPVTLLDADGAILSRIEEANVSSCEDEDNGSAPPLTSG
jgi:3-hydroxyacyl-CoA dehydrogenase